MLLKNKTIIVTGSSSGIGYAIATQCLEQGANVLMHGLEAQPQTTLLNEWGDKAHYLSADLMDENCAELITKTCIEVFGQIDGLVNNAGIYPRSNIHNSSALFDKVMTINVKAPMILCQHAVPFLEQSRGTIVNIGSINAHCGQPDLLLYSMSKGALMTMTRNLADALMEKHIRVNQLNVGWTATETELALKKKEGLNANWQQTLPSNVSARGAILQPSEIASHTLFWLSNASSPATGSVYEIEQYPFMGRNRLCDLITT